VAPQDENISERDWRLTPASVRRAFERVLGRLTSVEEQMAALREENAALREQLAQTSRTSSKPPSSDPPGAEPPAKAKPSKRRRGGQVGHTGSQRVLYPVEQCQKVVDHRPERCAGCGAQLAGTDPEPVRHQVVEVPEIVLQIDEHRLHALRCAACGHRTRAQLPPDVEATGYGPRLVALVALLQALLHASHRKTQAVIEEVFGVRLALGTLALLRIEASVAVEDRVEQASEYVRQQSVVGADETSWPQGNADGANAEKRRAWMWVAVTRWVVVFRVALSRSREAAMELVGAAFAGILVSDRYSVYGWKLGRWQVCWAHLVRDFRRMAERRGVSHEIGEGLLSEKRKLFRLWARVRDGTLSREAFRTKVTPIRRRVRLLLERGAGYAPRPKEHSARARTARTCGELLKVEQALWLFVDEEGVEPTNNASERALRAAVLWRKVSFGTQSAEGSLFVARMLTVLATLRAQKRRPFDYLVEAIAAARIGQPAPSLLPLTPSETVSP